MNKTILITGVTKGIGRAIALLFAEKGYNVAGCARNKKALDQLKAMLWNQYPEQKFLFATCNVADRNDLLSFAADVSDEFESIDVLVNNAGVYKPGKLLTEPELSIETMLETNLLSAYHITREIAPRMIAAQSGHIFNISSTAGIQAYPDGGSYSISKHALMGFSRVLREELKPHKVKVTSVIPGATYTSSWEGTTFPPERFIAPEDIAELIWTVSQLSIGANVEELLIRPQLGDFD